MAPPTIGFAGLSHLGICSALAAAAKGFSVVGFDPDPKLSAELTAGRLTIHEPRAAELLAAHGDRLRFTSDWAQLGQCDLVLIARDVPTDAAGESDLAPIRRLIETVSPRLAAHALLIVLCQVPPGFTRALDFPQARLFYQVETLIFGRAIERALGPERIIVGRAEDGPLPPAYRTYLDAFDCPVCPMGYESAELAKISINCCLVASVAIANTLAGLSERIGADWAEIAPVLKLDRRIGPHAYLSPGLGLSGGNLERDLATVLHLAWETGADASVVEAFLVNSRIRRDWALDLLHSEVLAAEPDPSIAVLGLAYKENTHSTKNSPAVALIRALAPYRLRLFDPVVPVGEFLDARGHGAASAMDALDGADVAVLATAWPEFRTLQPDALARVMRGRTVIDPYGLLDGAALAAAGFRHFRLGRSGHA